MSERELCRLGKLIRLEPAELCQVVTGTRLAGRARRPRQAQNDTTLVRFQPETEELLQLELEAGLLSGLSPERVKRVLILVEESTRQIPASGSRLVGTPSQQDTSALVEDDGLGSGSWVCVPDVAARAALGTAVDLLDSLAADGAEAPVVKSTHAEDHMSPRAAGATQHELSRIGLLATLPGETLARIAQRMTREEIPAGASVVAEGEDGDRFYVVLSGMLTVSQTSRGPQSVLRPGDYFGEVALAMNMPRTASVRALTPVTVASCDRQTFVEYIRPLFADDT